MKNPFGKLRDMLTSERADGLSELFIGDPRFDDWEPVTEFGDLTSASAWRQHLEDAGIEAVITSDWPPDRFGHGDIQLQVQPENWSEAEELVSGLNLD